MVYFSLMYFCEIFDIEALVFCVLQFKKSAAVKCRGSTVNLVTLYLFVFEIDWMRIGNILKFKSRAPG